MKSQSDPTLAGAPSPQSTAQAQFLVDEAYQLSHQVPTTTYEKLEIATEYQWVNDLPKALATAREANQQAQGPIEKITAYRSVALILFNLGDGDGARLALSEALEQANSGQPPLAPVLRNQALFETEGLWASAEIQWGNCAAGREHLGRAQANTTKAPPGIAAQWAKRLEALTAAVISCKPAG